MQLLFYKNFFTNKTIKYNICEKKYTNEKEIPKSDYCTHCSKRCFGPIEPKSKKALKKESSLHKFSKKEIKWIIESSFY
jgi:hypothetical protein